MSTEFLLPGILIHYEVHTCSDSFVTGNLATRKFIFKIVEKFTTVSLLPTNDEELSIQNIRLVTDLE